MSVVCTSASIIQIPVQNNDNAPLDGRIVDEIITMYMYVVFTIILQYLE